MTGHRVFLALLMGVLAQCSDYSKNDTQKPQSMITKIEAFEKAKNTLQAESKGRDWEIIDKQTVEAEFGWVFFYSTRQHIQTGDRKYAVPGNGQIAVMKDSGEVSYLPSAFPASVSIKILEEQWKKRKTSHPH